MAIPNKKAPKLEEFIDNLNLAMFERSRTNSIQNNICVFCGNPAIEFRDRLSQKEYTISGACQNCQDVIFTEPEEE